MVRKAAVKASAAKKAQAKKTRTPRATKTSAAEPKRRQRKASVAAVEKAVGFNVYSNVDDVLDDIEKNYSLSGSGMDKEEKRLSTGLLSLDLVLGGGVVGSGWYTFFGAEQSAKSTLSMTVMAAALNTEVPIIAVFDYEGCLTEDMCVTTSTGVKTFGDLVRVLGTSMEVGEFRPVNDLEVQTVGGKFVKVSALFFKGVHPITTLTVQDHKPLRGNSHRLLVQDVDGLHWRKIEEIKADDLVVVQDSF